MKIYTTRMEYHESLSMSSRTVVMANFIRDSGIKRLGRETESAFNSGLMVPNMKANGEEIKLMAKEE